MLMEESLNMSLSAVLQIMQHRLMTESTYFGVKALKSPTDFWVYQEIIYAHRPEVIVEIGNAFGGSTLALAHMCDLADHGEVVGIDISHTNIHDKVKQHPRIRLLEGDACQLFSSIQRICDGKRVLVIEDSSHTYENTLSVLKLYSQLTQLGDYLIVEDSICHHGLEVGPAPGPFEAIEVFVKENGSFEVDRSKESFLITWNPKGYLKKVR
jgi:cephalosporin hydroxylase